MSKKNKNKKGKTSSWGADYDKWVEEQIKLKKAGVCMVCGIEVVFNRDIFEITGMCGTCSTGEARLNYEED